MPKGDLYARKSGGYEGARELGGEARVLDRRNRDDGCRTQALDHVLLVSAGWIGHDNRVYFTLREILYENNIFWESEMTGREMLGLASAEELRERRRRLVQGLEPRDLGLVPGAPFPDRSVPFRQGNELFYLTGLEIPGSYLLIEGGEGRSTVYLPHRDERRERVDGPGAWAEDVDAVVERSGVDAVAAVETLPAALAHRLVRPLTLHVPHAPVEGERQSRDTVLAATAARLGDPFRPEGLASSSLVRALAEAFPSAAIADLTPALDALRLVKSESELAAIRAASELCGRAVIEAMRSTAPGVREYELAAVAEFVFREAGAAGGSYEAIVATGTNAWHGHYIAKDAELQAGELVLMDYAPDLAHYTSDIGRMWPVSGEWEGWQLELYGFILRYHRALLARLRPGVTADAVLDDAAEEMREVFAQTSWSAPEFERSAESALSFRGHLSHPVGLAVHDVGSYKERPLEVGLVLTVDPMLWVPERRLYVRCEDTVAVVEGGIENLTGFVPLEPAEIEATLKEQGLLQTWRNR